MFQRRSRRSSLVSLIARVARRPSPVARVTRVTRRSSLVSPQVRFFKFQLSVKVAVTLRADLRFSSRPSGRPFVLLLLREEPSTLLLGPSPGLPSPQQKRKPETISVVLFELSCSRCSSARRPRKKKKFPYVFLFCCFLVACHAVAPNPAHCAAHAFRVKPSPR